MRILMIGDIVGNPGRKIVTQSLRGLVKQKKIDLVVANAENAAGGSGITPSIYDELIEAGVGAITLGDHIYRRRAIIRILQTKSNIVKPANYPADAPGLDHCVVLTGAGQKVAVISLIGRVFMKPVDCPFAAVERVLGSVLDVTKIVIVDMHAEATSDMQLMGRFLDGRVSAVLGTHTHVPTADEVILPNGTAFQCDVGMTGPYESILGRRIDRVLQTTRHFTPTPFDVASEDVRLSGTLVDVDDASGHAIAVERVCVTESQAIDFANSESLSQ